MTKGRRLRVGDHVYVSSRIPLGHMRTPWYVRGIRGIVERYCGDFPNPELMAYHRSEAPRIPLYRVRFRMDRIWCSAEVPSDTLEVEVFGNWLEPVHP